jgi:uncharacterized protein (DUF1778 family)
MARARGKQTAKSTKDAHVQIRVSVDEKQALENAARRAGLGLSAWVRQLALRAAGALPPPEQT